MLTDEKIRRQKLLDGYVRDLSKNLLNEKEIREVVLKLLDIYNGGFRHSYSGFFPLILEISKDCNHYNLEFLSNNLNEIKEYIEQDLVSGKKEFEDIYEKLHKLCDHLNLEIGRWNYYSQTEQKIKDVESKSKDLSADMAKAEGSLREATKQASSLQTEITAVLSIFAAIVMTVSGGFSFLGSVMTSIKDAPYYEMVILTAIICGMVIFNTIFLMMYTVAKITKRDIFVRCMEENCTCESASEKKCNSFSRICKRMPYVVCFNLMCIIGIIIDCLVWYNDILGFFGR